jgi:hypothetical protein
MGATALWQSELPEWVGSSGPLPLTMTRGERPQSRGLAKFTVRRFCAADYRTPDDNLYDVSFDPNSKRKSEPWINTAFHDVFGNPAALAVNGVQHVLFRTKTGDIFDYYHDGFGTLKALTLATGNGSPTQGAAAAGEPTAIFLGGFGVNEYAVFYRSVSNFIRGVFWDGNNTQVQTWVVSAAAGDPALLATAAPQFNGRG